MTQGLTEVWVVLLQLPSIGVDTVGHDQGLHLFAIACATHVSVTSISMHAPRMERSACQAACCCVGLFSERVKTCHRQQYRNGQVSQGTTGPDWLLSCIPLQARRTARTALCHCTFTVFTSICVVLADSVAIDLRRLHDAACCLFARDGLQRLVLLQAGKVVIILTGRYAGKKAVIVRNYDDGTTGRKYGHAVVCGLSKEPRKVCSTARMQPAFTSNLPEAAPVAICSHMLWLAFVLNDNVSPALRAKCRSSRGHHRRFKREGLASRWAASYSLLV